MRFSLRSPALVAAVCAVLLGVAPGPASADVAGPVVLIGTAGLRWSDVGDATPTLKGLLAQDSSGWLAVRSVRQVTCPVDGWLEVSAGRRAADVQVGGKPGICREPQLATTEDGAPATVPQWSDYVAAAESDSFDASPGLLGTTLNQVGVSSAAVGPGAAIALADAQGRVARAWPGRVDDGSGTVAASVLAGDVRSALATDPRLVAVDLGAIRDPARQVAGEPTLTGGYARPRDQQIQALDTRLGLVLDELPVNATVIIASIADSGTPSQLQLLAARGPAPLGGSYSASLLGSRSTRQDGLAQTTDLLPTLMAALSVPVPVDAVGSVITPIQSGAGQTETEPPDQAGQRLRQLNDLADPSAAVAPMGPWVTNGLVIVQLLLYGVATLVLRRRSSGDDAQVAIGRLRALRRLRRGAVALATFPAASFLANLLPWWRAGNPPLALAGAVALFMIVISALALLGPWRGAVLGPMAVVAVVTAGVLTVDATTGSHLLLSSLLGVQPIVAGRFYGFNNQVFALFATAVLLCATVVAGGLVRRDHRYLAALAVAALGIIATVIDGTPGIGSDFGGPPAIIPAFAVLALLIAGIRVTWRRALLIAGVTIAVLIGLGVLDWLRAPGDRTHLGRFVQSAIDGGAWPIIRRKGAQNLKILFTSYLSALLPFAASFAYFVLGKPVAGPLRVAFDRAPALRDGLIAFVVMMFIAAALNDSGTAVPAFATMLALPLLIAACVRALELQDDGLSGKGPEPTAALAISTPMGDQP